MMKKFMDESFNKMRSAESAYELLQKFRQIQAHEASARLMERKTVDILLQYEKEVAHVQQMFDEGQEAPPLSKNQPPIAGAINWSHSLFLRVRSSIAKFKSMEELETTEQGKEVTLKFIALAKAVRHHELALFDEWKESVSATATELLKQPIFRAEHDGRELRADEWSPELEGASISVNFSEELVLLILSLIHI